MRSTRAEAADIAEADPHIDDNAHGRDPEIAHDPFARAQVESLVALYGAPLLILDLQRVRNQFQTLQRALPGVDMHYALKPLPHPAVVATLRDVGAWFDLATSGEVDLVKRMGVPPARCIHTHPIKREIDIRNALSFGVDCFVADNPDEIRKFEKYRHRASLLLRVSFRSPGAVCDLSRKFGCDPAALPDLLRLAAQLRIKVRGLSFHVGSQAGDPHKHVEAVEVCNELMRGASEHRLDVLDIGGGFPVAYRKPAPAIETFCAPIRAALGKLPAGTRIIAEPGRFVVAPAAMAVASVMGRAQRDGRPWYYLDDGVYGSFSGQVYDHAKYPIEALAPCGPKQLSVLAGPTCDSIDVIDEAIMLPELAIGDLIVARVMGAYTWASATEFNFFPKTKVIAMDGGRRIEEP